MKVNHMATGSDTDVKFGKWSDTFKLFFKHTAIVTVPLFAASMNGVAAYHVFDARYGYVVASIVTLVLVLALEGTGIWGLLARIETDNHKYVSKYIAASASAVVSLFVGMVLNDIIVYIAGSDNVSGVISVVPELCLSASGMYIAYVFYNSYTDYYAASSVRIERELEKAKKDQEDAKLKAAEEEQQASQRRIQIAQAEHEQEMENMRKKAQLEAEIMQNKLDLRIKHDNNSARLERLNQKTQQQLIVAQTALTAVQSVDSLTSALIKSISDAEKEVLKDELAENEFKYAMALLENPDLTHKQAAEMIGCSPRTSRRYKSALMDYFSLS